MEECTVTGVVKVTMGYQNELEVPRGAADIFKLFYKLFTVGRVACVDEDIAFFGFYEVTVRVREVLKCKDYELLHVVHFSLDASCLVHEESKGYKTNQPHEEDHDNIDQNEGSTR